MSMMTPVVDCEWEYGEFEECSSSCGEGTRNRYPIITVEPMHGGVECPEDVTEGRPETEACNSGPCPGKAKLFNTAIQCITGFI